jgi:hypothetical protein
MIHHPAYRRLCERFGHQVELALEPGHDHDPEPFLDLRLRASQSAIAQRRYITDVADLGSAADSLLKSTNGGKQKT